jgi:DNA-binding CsgD family transcriptional regulator
MAARVIAEEERAKSESIIETIGDAITIQDTNFKILYQNQVHKNLTGDHIGDYCYIAYKRSDHICEGCPVDMSFKDGDIHTKETSTTFDGEVSYVEIMASPLKDKTGKIIAGIEVVRDITRRKRAEEALKARGKELEFKTKNLEEANIALKVLLKRRDEDKAELEEKILLNIEELVAPYLEKLKTTGLDEKQKTYLSILESNLNDIISPFSHKLSSMFLDFTPTEIQVANLLRQGKTNKEIGELFHCTPRTVAFHRDNIRKKLGLKNKKANLKSYLLSLQK